MCSTLHVFHAFTGCDIVWAFEGEEARKQLGSHGSRTQKLRAHLETSCSCKMGSVNIPCQPYNGLWCLCMIEQMTSQWSMIVGNNCSLRSPEYWRIYHLRRQHFSIMWNGLLIKPSAEPRLWLLTTSSENWGWKKDSVTEWQPFWTTFARSIADMLWTNSLRMLETLQKSRAEMHCSLWLWWWLPWLRMRIIMHNHYYNT